LVAVNDPEHFGRGDVDPDGGFRLGPWEIRPRLGMIASGEQVNRVEPRVMAVLVCLARHAPNVVTRDEFIREVWRGRIVTDEVLSRCISLLRAALDDQPRDSRLIQTLPRIGYRLLAEVLPLEPLAGQAGSSAAPALPAADADVAVVAAAVETPVIESTRRVPPWRRRSLLGVSVLLAAALLYAAAVYWRSHGPSPVAEAGRNSVAVLPFVNHSDSKDDDYFSDGLSEELISRLSNVRGLKVVASTSAFSLKEHPGDVRKIGRRLGAAYVVEGNVRREGDQVRIAAQLIDARSGYHVMTRSYEGSLANIFALQDEVATGIVAELAKVLTEVAADTTVETPRPTRNVAAYELVLRGRQQFRIREEASVRRSIALFEQALVQDPGYVDAYGDLARAQVVLPSYSLEDQEEMFDAALSTLRRGERIDPRAMSQFQDIVGFIEHSRWHWAAADAAYQRALALRPRDSNLLQWYSQFLASVGRTRASLEYAQQAKEVDVISPVVNDRLAVAYLWNDQDQLADRQFGVARELGIRVAAQPDAYLLLLLRLGRYEEARSLALTLQKMFARPAAWLDPLLAALADPALRPAAVAAVEAAERDRNISGRYALGAWMYLGEDDRALQAVLDLLPDRGEFEVELLFSREARGVRTHQRFGEVLAQLGLVEYWDATSWPDACRRLEGAIKCR
jgi:TolB-like protein/DNA-binding winged helix-turn-helix (wHTH) protein/tetratricopeptide (TPR) repeat protein